MKAPIAQFCALLGKAPDCTIGIFIGYHGQKRIKNNSDCRWGLISRLLVSST
jgi:hypothetical protein